MKKTALAVIIGLGLAAFPASAACDCDYTRQSCAIPDTWMGAPALVGWGALLSMDQVAIVDLWKYMYIDFSMPFFW